MFAFTLTRFNSGLIAISLSLRPLYVMKARSLYIFTLLLLGIFAVSSAEAKANKSFTFAKSCITVKAPTTNSQKQPNSDSPFIRFHHGIDEIGVSVSSQNESIVPLKPINSIPEKFSGITEYLSSLSYRVPVTRVFLYSTPLRSPPFFC